MKKAALFLILLLLLASCGRQPTTVPIAGDADAEETSLLDLSQQIAAQTTLDAADVTCEPLRRDGGVYGFEMRFRRTEKSDAMLRSEDNFYFGVLTAAGKKYAVPTEDVRVLADVPTGTFAVTLLAPQGAKLTGEATVSFYVSTRAEGAANALLAAHADVKWQ